MEDKKQNHFREITVDELDGVAGGTKRQYDQEYCDHRDVILHGLTKTENGVKYEYITCKICEWDGWVKQSTLLGGAVEEGSPFAPAWEE